MKKLVLTLLLVFSGICALQAQNYQSSIMSFLREEGYSPSYDDDGDLQFRVQGNIYYVIVREVADYAYVEVRVPVQRRLHPLRPVCSGQRTSTATSTSASARSIRDPDGQQHLPTGHRVHRHVDHPGANPDATRPSPASDLHRNIRRTHLIGPIAKTPCEREECTPLSRSFFPSGLHG